MLAGRTPLPALSAVVFLSLACGGGDGNGGTGPAGLTFPPLNSSVNAAFCVRGNLTVGANKSSSIADTDCDYADVVGGGGGYLETWRVRVAEATTVTVTVDAPNFDSYLDAFEFTVSSGDVAGFTFLDFDDDTNDDDPVLTIDLEPDTDYAFLVSGYDYPDVGAYTLTIE